MMNPALVQQGAALIGLELSQNTAEPEKKPSSEEQLAKFYEQLPFASSQNSTAIPPTPIPTVVIPEPTPSPIPSFHAAPATPFSPPIAETPAPTHANQAQAPPNWGNSDWNSEAAVPIYPIPVQEPVSAPQRTIYAPPQEMVPVVGNTLPSGFVQTMPVPPQPQQPFQQQPIQPPPSANAIQTPAVLIEEVPVHGTEMVARVGTQVILMGDILPKLRRTALQFVATKLETMPEEERAKIPRQEIEKGINDIVISLYPEVLQEQILFALVYNDYVLQQARDQKNMIDEKLGEEFDQKEIPQMLKEFKVENIVDLKRFLEQQLGSSLEKERRFWVREQIVRQWIGMSIQRATADPTQDEMMDYYERNKAMFTSTARARWQEMVVLFSRHNTEQEAWEKMKWMGNQVASGAASFEEIAKTQSDGFTAIDGGVWDWTTKGSLASAELEQAVFSQPIRQLSPRIIRSDKGLHIIRVLEREEERIMPFIEAQVKIKERIRNQRTQQNQDEYLAGLRRRFPTLVVRDRIDFNINNNTRTASRTQ